VSFRRGATRFSREVIASASGLRDCCAPLQQQAWADQLRRKLRSGHDAGRYRDEGQDTLILRGHAYERMHSNGRDGVALEIRVRVIPEGGSVWASAQGLQVKKRQRCHHPDAAGTNFDGGNPEDACARALAQASSKSYAQLRVAHIADHQAFVSACGAGSES